MSFCNLRSTEKQGYRTNYASGNLIFEYFLFGSAAECSKNVQQQYTYKRMNDSLSDTLKPGVSKVFARRAVCGEMNICGSAFDYNTGRGPYSIHFMNEAARAGQNLIKGRTWPAGRTLDMPALNYSDWDFEQLFLAQAALWKHFKTFETSIPMFSRQTEYFSKHARPHWIDYLKYLEDPINLSHEAKLNDIYWRSTTLWNLV